MKGKRMKMASMTRDEAEACAWAYASTGRACGGCPAMKVCGIFGKMRAHSGQGEKDK